MVFFVPTASGAETTTLSSGTGADPTAVLLLEQGEKLINENQMEGALASFDLAIQVDPGLSKAYFRASAVASQLGHNEKAIAYLSNLLKRNPSDTEAQGLLANLAKKTEVPGESFGFSSSGFLEFGVAALLGSAFFFFIGGYFGESPPRDRAKMPVEKPYFVYPLLKVIWQGTQRELLAVHEKRHRSLTWQANVHA